MSIRQPTFAELPCANESIPNRFRFAGMPYETEVDAGDSSKLTARYFDPSVGSYFRPSLNAYMNRANTGNLNLYSFWKRDEQFPIIPNNPGMTYPWVPYEPQPVFPGFKVTPEDNLHDDWQNKDNAKDNKDGGNGGNGGQIKDPKPQPEPTQPFDREQWLKDLHEKIQRGNAEYLARMEEYFKTPAGRQWLETMRRLQNSGVQQSGVEEVSLWLSFGHFSLGIGEKKYGFYPDKRWVVSDGFISLDNDIPGIKMPLFPLGPNGIATLKNIINHDISHAPGYNLATFNCYIWAMSRYYIARDTSGDTPKANYGSGGGLSHVDVWEQNRRNAGLPVPQR